MPILFILFIVIPIVEITLLINVGQLIGAWYTVGLVLLSAFIGVNMLRYQGSMTLRKAQQKMAHGEMPQQEMIEGLVLAVGGALLITPGFFTDSIGFCCLIPITRLGFIKLVSSKFKSSMSARMSGGSGFTHMHNQSDPFSAGPFSQDKTAGGDVFEGEYVKEVDPRSSLGHENKPSDTDR